MLILSYFNFWGLSVQIQSGSLSCGSLSHGVRDISYDSIKVTMISVEKVYLY